MQALETLNSVIKLSLDMSDEHGEASALLLKAIGLEIADRKEKALPVHYIDIKGTRVVAPGKLADSGGFG
eukprot:2616174-Amphidinium_carterae.1